jgi:hypothetical protein
MITTDQIKAICAEIDKTSLLQGFGFRNAPHLRLKICLEIHGKILKESGIAIIENERLEYNAAGVK